jgi:hypothetical protein
MTAAMPFRAVPFIVLSVCLSIVPSVAHDAAHEGSYGSGSSGMSRAPGPVQCLPTAATTTCP